MSNMDRLQVVDVFCTNCSANGYWCTGAGFAPSELSTRFSVCCENRFTANTATPAATARPIPTLHLSPELPTVEETCVFVAFVSTACSSLLVASQLKTTSFAAANSAVSTSSFCQRATAPLHWLIAFYGLSILQFVVVPIASLARLAPLPSEHPSFVPSELAFGGVF